jgi:glycosyltransferase involved in cell wall biosynthesis
VAPLVSVGLPTYNRARSLDRAISSVAHQTYSTLEIILSDNGSSDATSEVCEHWARRDSRVRYIRHATNLGPVANFNFVIQAMRGEYALLLADDDWVDEHYVERCITEFSRRPGHALVAGRARFLAGEVLVGHGVPVDLSDDDPARRLRRHLHEVRDNSVFYGVMKREHLAAASPLRDVLAGDWLLVAGVAYAGKVITIDSTRLHRSVGGTSRAVTAITSTLRRRSPVSAAIPWVTTAATAAADVGWRSPAYSTVSPLRRPWLALIAASSIMRWKSTLFLLAAPLLRSLSNRRRGRWLWLTFAAIVRRTGRVHEGDLHPAR